MSLHIMWVYTVIICSIFCGIVTSDSDTSPVIKESRVGGCYNVRDGYFIQCVAFEEECRDIPNVEFKRADELERLGVSKCSTEKLPIGICESTEKCAITKDSCAEPNDYRSPSAANLCNAEGRFSNNGDFIHTQYGACKDKTTGKITCALSSADCLVEEHWIAASVVEKERLEGCRCSDVRIGVCMDSPAIDPTLSHCAISVDDCHPLAQTFGTARKMEDDARLDCRLCPIKAINGDSRDDPDSEDDHQDVIMKKVEEDALSRGKLIGFAMGGSITFIITVFLVTICRCKRKDKSHQSDPTDLPALV